MQTWWKNHTKLDICGLTVDDRSNHFNLISYHPTLSYYWRISVADSRAIEQSPFCEIYISLFFQRRSWRHHVLLQALGSGNTPVKPRACTKGPFLPPPARQFPEQNCKGKRIYETTAISQSKRKKIETALKRKKSREKRNPRLFENKAYSRNDIPFSF